MVRFQVPDEQLAFSVVEESGFFRLVTNRKAVGPQQVEDFLDTTVEWLSSNPEKGILLDFKGVKSVSDDFVAHLLRYYEEIKARGLYVRIVNVDPAIEQYVETSNITVVISPDMLPAEKPVVSAREILKDLASDISDEELMEKHHLSEKGLRSMFRKMLGHGLISKRVLARRWGMQTDDVVLRLEGKEQKKVRVKGKEVLRDIAEGISDKQIKSKYKLSNRGLQSLLRKLRDKRMISAEDFVKWRRSQEKH
jgi:anti-anti-sigma regulatory factor/uncharacterized protein (DUF433 family)